MANSGFTMDLPRIKNITDEGAKFIAEWHNPLPYIIAHTSGSTGKPKEIRLLKSDIKKSAQATCLRFGITEKSILYLPLSASYIAGKMMIARAIVSGAELIMETPGNNLSINAPHIDLAAIVPSQIPALISSHAIINHAIIGGAEIPHALEQRMLETPIKSYATYGMTETCSHVALRRLGEREYTAIPGITFSTDCRGCLVINSSEMSFNKLVTNDIVNLSSPTSFAWLGRVDNVINSGGIKLHAEQIENEIRELIPEITTFYITSTRHDKWGEELTMVVESSNPIPNLETRLQLLANTLHKPKNIIYRQYIERTSSGKIIRTKH